MPTPAETEALGILQDAGFQSGRGMPIAAEHAADVILELAFRIRLERAQAKVDAILAAEPKPKA